MENGLLKLYNMLQAFAMPGKMKNLESKKIAAQMFSTVEAKITVKRTNARVLADPFQRVALGGKTGHHTL